MLLHGPDHLHEFLMQKCRFSSGNTKFRGILGHPWDHFKNVIYQVSIVYIAGWLRAHQTSAVATLREKQKIMLAPFSIQNSGFTRDRIEAYDITLFKKRTFGRKNNFVTCRYLLIASNTQMHFHLTMT